MTYYLYKTPSGRPDVTDYPLNLSLFAGYELVAQSEACPDTYGKVFAGDTLVPDRTEPEYVTNRRAEYPTMGDQLDALWHAMAAGVLPQVEPFYSSIAQVKNKYPKDPNTQ